MLKLFSNLLPFAFALSQQITHKKVTRLKALEMRYIPRIQREVTFLGLGAIEIGRDWGLGTGQARQHATPAAAKQVLQTALQQGINVIDTASSYHLSEEYIGQFIADKRADYMLNTKPGEYSMTASDERCQIPAYDNIYCNYPAAVYDFSRAAIRRDIEESLKKLRTSFIDIAFIHFGPDTAAVLDKGEAVAELKALQAEGKIRHLGASLDDVALTKRCILSNDYDAIELEYNLLNQSNAENIVLAQQHGLGVFVRGGLGTGLLTAKAAPYLADSNLPYSEAIKALLNLVTGDYDKLTALALAFLYKNSAISSVVVGVRRAELISKNIHLLQDFNDNGLLSEAEKLLSHYQTGPFTDSIDAYFVEKEQQRLSQ